MTTDKLHPTDLREGLGTVPLLHLIPKQDLAPLVSFNAIDTEPNDIEEMEINSTSVANKMRSAMNGNPEYFSKVIDYLAEDFRSFEDRELDDITFKKPIIAKNSLTDRRKKPEILPFEKRLFEEMSEVDDSCVEDKTIILNTLQIDKSELSIQDDYDANTVFSIQQHNEKFNQKFELQKKKMAKQNVFAIPIHFPDDHSAGQSKHLLDNTEATPAQQAKRFQKTYLERDQLKTRACEELIEIINNIGLVDEDINNDKYFSSIGESKLLTTETLIFILDRLLRILNDHVIDQVSLEYLIRIEKLCIRSISEGVLTNWNELIELSDVNTLQEFMKNYDCVRKLFELALNGTISAKIILLILDSRRNNKQLFLDEYFKSIIDLIYLLVQDVIIPFASKTIPDIQIVNVLRGFCLGLITDVCSIKSMVSIHIEKNEVDEYLLTRLEYLSIIIVFAESNIKERVSIVGVSNFDNLRVCSCKVLTCIFKHHLDQRQFILNEVLSNFDKLPTHKVAARRFKLNRGGNIQLTTVLLLNLLQSFDITKYSLDANEARQANSDDKYKSLVENKRRMIMENVSLSLEEVTKTSNDIATFLMNKLYNNPDNQQKLSLELLLEDLLAVVILPEWPSAEILLISIFKALLFVIQSGTYSSLIETSALELSGMIGAKIFELKQACTGVHQLNVNSSNEDILFYSGCFIDSLEYVQLQSMKNTNYITAFRLLIMKFICRIKVIIQDNDRGNTENQLAALNSDNDNSSQLATVRNNANLLYDRLLGILADDSINLNQTLKSNMDALSISSYIQILLTQELLDLFDNFLNVMVNTLDSTKVKSKTKAIRTLSSLIDIDPTLLVAPKIQESVSKRLLDSSPLVRDAVIDLISRFMLSKPEVIDQFHRPICDRLNDDSIQVRKRVIKLSKEMYLKTDKVSIKSQISMKILRRLDDEDDIMASIAKSYLLELWFTSLADEIRSMDMGQILEATAKRADVIMEITSIGGRTAAYFETFLTEYVLCNPDPKVILTVKLIIDKTLDRIIDCVNTKSQTQVEKALMLISTFVKCDGKLMTQDQLVSLQPYLVDEKNSGEAVCFYSLQILKYVLPCFPALRPGFVDAAETYLLRRLTKFNVKELHEAMPCVWRLCYMNKDTVKLANASISCMKLIKPFFDLSKKDEKIGFNTKLHRLLHLLGCFGTYCKLEKHRDIYLKARIGLKENETVISVITKFLLFFCGSNFLSQIKKIAIKNIISICSTHPKLFMSEAILKVLDREFDDVDVDIKRTIIQGFMDFLKNEDNNSKKLNGVQTKSSTEIKLDVAVFHGDAKSYVNDGICAGIIQRYLEKILEFCLQESDELAVLPVQFVQLVIKLGFANPKICIPYIIALESTTNPHIRHIAFELHTELFEKHESLTDSSYLEGLKLAVAFRKRTSNNIYQEKFFINNLYSIVNGNYSSRKKLVLSLAKVFNINLGFTKLEDNTFQRDTIIYTAFNIAAIHFASLEEVLIFVYNINRVISREGLDLSDKILKETNPDSPNTQPTSYKRNLCVNAQTLTALISFRNHLVATHAITGVQIENYKPNRTELELRQPPKLVNEIPLSIETEGLNSVLKNSENFGPIYTRFFQAIHEFTE